MAFLESIAVSQDNLRKQLEEDQFAQLQASQEKKIACDIKKVKEAECPSR